ncbi:MAG: alanine dehydrogenase [Deltaproteobacteria bacterium]|nr:alanine dehydrogenase [Deltaproteobacteria bacterium]
MLVGVPKEIKAQEYRVAATPAGVRELTADGHQVWVETGAGLGSGLTDQEFAAAGARLVSREEAWSADLVLKVKEPLESEFGFFRPGLILFTFLHLAAAPALAAQLVAQKVAAVAYETIQLADGSLPLLIPMSQVAGRLAVQAGAHFLERPHGGRGLLLGGVPGAPRGRVTIIGAGAVGVSAAQVALGLGARVTVLNRSLEKLRRLEEIFGPTLDLELSLPAMVAAAVAESDLVIGAVLVPGAKAPSVVTEDMVRSMAPGSVIVDVAIDQGGSVATMHATTHDDPVFTVHGVIHYGVANMPGAVARTSTFALTAASLPYARFLAAHGLAALRRDPALALGVNLLDGRATHPAVARALGLPSAGLALVLDELGV